MSEEETKSVETEVSEAVAPAAESEVSNEAKAEAQESERRKRNDAEYNWAETRRHMREKDRQIEELRDQILKIQKPAAPVEDEELRLAKDDILTVEAAEKLIDKKAQKIAEKIIKQREAATVDERIELKFPDYRDIVTKENIELLKQTEPELALTLMHTPDPYQQAVAAYKLLKKVGIKSENPMPIEKKKALENSQKPLSVQAIAKTSSLADVNQFAEMDAKGKKEFLRQKYEEMQKAVRAG
jgi:hypothetical protein